jgi:hypothetical protein
MFDIQYSSIINRSSTRRYEKNPISLEKISKLESIQDLLIPLVPENQFHFQVHDFNGKFSLMGIMGGYGVILNPPHFILPTIIGDRHQLTDLGFRLEQVVLWLQENTIANCYVGALGRENKLIERFNLPERSRIGSLIVFGNPSQTGSGKNTNHFIRKTAGGKNRKALDSIYFTDDFSQPGLPPNWLGPIIEAGRFSPSAVNAQPWRFLYDGKSLYVYITRNNLKYGLGLHEEYCFLDGGIAMANILHAVQTLGFKASWSMTDSNINMYGNHKPPKNIELLAKMEIHYP